MKLLSQAIAFISPKEKVPEPFQPLTGYPLIIMVGLTGVGKSTTLALLKERLDFSLLPDRRKITDEIIIASLQQADGQAPALVTDRVKRFEYTARYRTQHPGGMAYALSQVAVDPGRVNSPLLFDGLRGLNEVQHAAGYFPKARFIILDAPDLVRLARLLRRDDAFDSTKLPPDLASRNMIAGLLAIPDIEAVFSEEHLRQISRMARAANLSIDEVIKKASIIVEERRNYDSSAARVYLARTLPRRQVLIVNTDHQSPQEIVRRISDWLIEPGE
jgi:hypothetical protein